MKKPTNQPTNQPTNLLAFDEILPDYLTPHHLSVLARDFYRTTVSVVDELLGMLDRWTFETRTHSCRVTLISLRIGEAMGLGPKELFELGAGALLHDIGKIRIPREILMKPGPLSPEEWIIMKTHPERGGDILARFPSLQFAGGLVVQHQERWNGSGYPRGLRGEELVLGARIFAVADSFDAMTSQRSYNIVRSADDALHDLIENAGSLYDPRVVHAFMSLDGESILDETEDMEKFLEKVFPAERFVQIAFK